MSLYDDLGVSKDASFDDIRAAYRKRAMSCHPDVGGDREEFERIQNAYDVLANPDRRFRYDETGETEAGPDNRLSELSEIIISAFDHVLAQAGAKFREHDLIKHTCTVLRRKKQTIKATISSAANDKAKLEELLNRLNFEGAGPDILGNTLRQRIRSHENGISLAEHKVEVIDQAEKYLGSYGFTSKRAELSGLPSDSIDYDAITFEGLSDHDG